MKTPQKANKSSQRVKARNLTWEDLFDATYRASREEGVPNFSSGSSNRASGRNIEL
jgi:hypothetical protein